MTIIKRTHISRGLFARLSLAAILLLAAASSGPAWQWELPTEHFKRLDLLQRSEYQKAARIHNDKDYKGAVPKWEKFRLEFEDELDEDILAYVIFMKGYDQLLARNRHDAIKIYTEVLDFFPNTTWVAAPALYFRGISHFENGDTRKGYNDMKLMVEHDAYRHHSLAAGALRRLADNHWRNKEVARAIKYWKQTHADFTESNPTEASQAADNVVDYYIRGQKYDQILNWRTNDENREDPGHRRGVADWVYKRAINGFRHVWGEYYTTLSSKKQKQADIKAFLAWYARQRTYYEKSDLWPYLTQLMYFHCYVGYDKKLRDALVTETTTFIKTCKAKDSDKQARYLWVFDRLRDAGDILAARALLAVISDRHTALWKEYELTGSYEKKWKEAAAILERLENMQSEYWTKRARRTRADIYRQHIGRYEQAIKIYHEIAEPPGTLWSIQECYRKWGKTKEAHATLVEIAAMFPPLAPQSVYQQAEYSRADGQNKNAVALYRQILKAWPQAPQASSAHQRLEEYGISTGGGVTAED